MPCRLNLARHSVDSADTAPVVNNKPAHDDKSDDPFPSIEITPMFSTPMDVEGVVEDKAHEDSNATAHSSEHDERTDDDKDNAISVRSSLDDDLNLSDNSEDEKIEVQNSSNNENTNDSSNISDNQSVNSLKSPSKIYHQQFQYRNILDELLGTFSTQQRKREKGLEQLRTKFLEERKSMNYIQFSAILKKNIKLVLQVVSPAQLEQICEELCVDMDTEMQQRMFCDHVYELLMVRKFYNVIPIVELLLNLFLN